MEHHCTLAWSNRCKIHQRMRHGCTGNQELNSDDLKGDFMEQLNYICNIDSETVPITFTMQLAQGALVYDWLYSWHQSKKYNFNCDLFQDFPTLTAAFAEIILRNFVLKSVASCIFKPGLIMLLAFFTIRSNLNSGSTNFAVCTHELQFAVHKPIGYKDVLTLNWRISSCCGIIITKLRLRDDNNDIFWTRSAQLRLLTSQLNRW